MGAAIYAPASDRSLHRKERLKLLAAFLDDESVCRNVPGDSHGHSVRDLAPTYQVREALAWMLPNLMKFAVEYKLRPNTPAWTQMREAVRLEVARLEK